MGIAILNIFGRLITGTHNIHDAAPLINQKTVLTRAVLVIATERKNHVNPCLRSQKKVNYVQLFLHL